MSSVIECYSQALTKSASHKNGAFPMIQPTFLNTDFFPLSGSRVTHC